MLEIKRDGNSAIIHMDTDLPHNRPYVNTLWVFKSEEGSPWHAELVVRYLKNRLKECVKQIRRDAYEQGWKDARAKRVKETWFSGEL